MRARAKIVLGTQSPLPMLTCRPRSSWAERPPHDPDQDSAVPAPTRPAQRTTPDRVTPAGTRVPGIVPPSLTAKVGFDQAAWDAMSDVSRLFWWFSEKAALCRAGLRQWSPERADDFCIVPRHLQVAPAADPVLDGEPLAPVDVSPMNVSPVPADEQPLPEAAWEAAASSAVVDGVWKW